MGDRALLRPHAVHVRPLLRHPGQRGDDPARVPRRPGDDAPRDGRHRRRLDPAGVRLLRLPRRPRRPRRLTAEPGASAGEDRPGRPGDDVARDRRGGRLAADCDPDRSAVGVTAALVARPGRDAVRPRGRLSAPALDRAGPLVQLRVQARGDADRGLLRRLRSLGHLWWPGAVGLSPAPPLDRLRRGVRGDLCADDPRERARGVRRRPRAYGPGDRDERGPDPADAGVAERDAAARDDGRDGPGHRLRRRDLRRARVRAARHRQAADLVARRPGPAGDPRDRRARDDRDPRLQPARRPALPIARPRIGYGSASQSAKARSKWLRGRAPTTVALGSPAAKRITVGSERTP